MHIRTHKYMTRMSLFSVQPGLNLLSPLSMFNLTLHFFTGEEVVTDDGVEEEGVTAVPFGGWEGAGGGGCVKSAGGDVVAVGSVLLSSLDGFKSSLVVLEVVSPELLLVVAVAGVCSQASVEFTTEELPTTATAWKKHTLQSA